MKVNKVASFIFLLALIPASAFASGIFNGAGANLTQEIFDITSPFAAVAIIILGVMALCHVVQWATFGFVALGVGIIYGHQQVLGFFRSVLGV